MFTQLGKLREEIFNIIEETHLIAWIFQNCAFLDCLVQSFFAEDDSKPVIIMLTMWSNWKCN